MAVCLLLIIIGIAVLLYMKYVKNKNDQKTSGQVCREKFESLKKPISEIYQRDAHVKWGTGVRKSTISQLISMRFYYDGDRKISYLSVNLDNTGRKALYQEKGGTFRQIMLEDDEDFGRTLAVVPGLVENPVNSSIEMFNEMERQMPSLASLPYISFGFNS